MNINKKLTREGQYETNSEIELIKSKETGDIMYNSNYGVPVALADKKYVNNLIDNTISNFPIELNLKFKLGSVGEKVSFKKQHSDPYKSRDIIIPGELEITRDNNGGGIYNIAIENSYSQSNSPQNTMWATKYNNPTFDSWAPLWDLSTRTYEKWRKAIQIPTGDYATPQYVGMPVIMKWDNGIDAARYWLIIFTEWGVGSYGESGIFAYDRYEIYPAITFTRPDDEETTVDIISESVHIARKNNGGQIYNAITEPYSNSPEYGVSPRGTRWNSIFTDPRTDYYGFTDLSNLESRVYTDFASSLDGSVGNNIFNTDLIMHDMTTDLYYKITFSEWTSGGNGGGFEYTRTVIPQSEQIKFADGTQLNTAPLSTTSNSIIIDNDGNSIIDDTSNNLINIGPGDTHLVDNFSGMVIVNDHFDGGIETWICGGGDCVMLNHTSAAPGNSTFTMNSNGYEWTNVDNLTGPFTFTVIKTRQGS